jgi:spermidine/putrescine transport system substrate-binding protein
MSRSTRTGAAGVPTVGRRDFLAGLGAMMGAAGLAGCASGGTAPTFELGAADELWILNWSDYIDVDDSSDLYYQGGTLDLAAKEFDMFIRYAADYADNIDGFEVIRQTCIESQPPLYDIVVPTNWRAAQMIANGWAEPIPIEIVPNHVNIDPAFLTNAWDRGCRYQMPWQAGITGIAYDPAATGRELNSVTDLFDPAFAGRVGFIGEMREAVGLAMLANGDDPSRPTKDTAEAGLATVVDAAESGQVAAFTYEDFADRLVSGELAVAMAWSGDAAGMQADNPNLRFIVPDEGAIQWFDTMVIPTGSARMRAAGQFMNFVYNPENAARITEWVQYISPVMGVQDELLAMGGSSAELANNPILFPDDATRARLFTWGGLDQADEDALDATFATLLPE